MIADFYPSLIKHDKLAALGALTKTRVCLICGERDLLTPPEHAVEMAEQLPDVELLIVPGAGHQVPLERPDLVERPLLQMVRDIMAAIR